MKATDENVSEWWQMMYRFTDDRSIPASISCPYLGVVSEPKGYWHDFPHWPSFMVASSEVPAFQPLFSTWNSQMVGVFPIGKSSSRPYFLGLHVETWGTPKQPHFIAVGFGMVYTWKTQTKDHRVVPEYGRESTLWYHVLLIPNILLELSKCIFSGRSFLGFVPYH